MGSPATSFTLRLPQDARLGDWSPQPCAFPFLESVFKEFAAASFKGLSEHQKIAKVSSTLLDLIQKTPPPCFLLPCILDFIGRINQQKIVLHYTLSSFELFLNQFANLSREENYEVRSKIVGKWIPRDRYQDLFPIGSGKHYAGTHFVTAHSSPDLDTTVASFWGWVDAFGCRISEGFHVWNVPGGPPEGQVEINFLFHQIFGPNVFQSVAKTRSSLGVTGLDLMTQKNMIKKTTVESARDIDHERTQNAIVLTDENGYYVGDWRNFDVEGVRQVIMLLANSLQWFEHYLHAELIGLFGRDKLHLDDVRPVISALRDFRIGDCRPAKEMTEKQREYLQAFLSKVLRIPAGVDATFTTFAEALEKMQLLDFRDSLALLESLEASDLFDSSGRLIENRPKIFHYLEKVINGVDIAIQRISSFVDRLDVALNIKTLVFGHQPQFVSSRADVDEIRSKMGSYPYLTITGSDSQGGLTPLGIVQASELFHPVLGTVSLRDFCNREETKIPSYLEVISVIDHHKSTLQTSSAPVATISNAQSSNCMVAEFAFGINDTFSMGGMTREEIGRHLKESVHDLSSSPQRRIFQRLLQRQIVAERQEPFFVDPSREFVEYLHFLYAILDDTDLLTKVSIRDVECVASLLNRLKSLTEGREVETVHFDDLARDDKFATAAARRLLQNEELYSLYHKIYREKEKAVEANIRLCFEGKPSTLFADTKVQNGCCRVGQTKMFAKNFPVFESHADPIRAIWLQEAEVFQHERPECDLHLHMISTLAGAEDLFKGTSNHYTHRDELWVWIPMHDAAIGHLKSFLNGFRSLAQLQTSSTEVEFLGENGKDLDQIFNESFMPCPRKIATIPKLPIAIIRFKAGSINSRKAQISPFLPRSVT